MAYYINIISEPFLIVDSPIVKFISYGFAVFLSYNTGNFDGLYSPLVNSFIAFTINFITV